MIVGRQIIYSTLPVHSTIQSQTRKKRHALYPILLSCLLFETRTALDTFRHRLVDVVVGDPALIVAFAGTSSDDGSLGAGEGLGFGSDSGFAGLASGTRGTSLRKQGFDPGLVNPIADPAKERRQEEVEEYSTCATKMQSVHAGAPLV